jgi:ABC-type Fe3+-citrate transport system substrate-binding protein
VPHAADQAQLDNIHKAVNKAVDRYRPLTGRRRVLLAAMAVLVACTVIPYMVRHYGMVKALAPLAPMCAPGQSEGCVGGRVQMITTTPAPAAPASATR